jgi:hypothetical protein
VNVLLSAPSWSYEDSRGILTDSLAYSLLVPSLIESELDSTEREDLQDFWSGASRDRTGDLLLAKQIGLSTRVSWCLEKPLQI